MLSYGNINTTSLAFSSVDLNKQSVSVLAESFLRDVDVCRAW